MTHPTAYIDTPFGCVCNIKRIMLMTKNNTGLKRIVKERYKVKKNDARAMDF